MVIDVGSFLPLDEYVPVEFESAPNDEFFGDYSAINGSKNSGEFTPHQNFVLGWLLPFGALMSFLGGLYICYWSWKRRDHVYHRLMFAVSIYLLLWSPWMMYGSAALPAGTPGFPWASGSIATCTAQGFFAQLSTACPAYYVALSCFSWIVVVYGNFDPSRYAWVEKYIHLGVNLWAICSASSLAYLRAFNPTQGWPSCWIGAVPTGCGTESGIPCTRGPQNHEQIRGFFLGALSIAFLLFPAITMAALACFLYRRQKLGRGPRFLRNCDATAWAVTKQSMVYIGTLWFVYAPTLLITSFETVFQEKLFFFYCIGTFISLSVGFWFALVYRYFSSASESGIIIAARNLRRGSKCLADTTKQQLQTSVNNGTRRTLRMSDRGMSDREGNHCLPSKEESPTESSSDHRPIRQNDEENQSSKRDDSQISFTFNIFDGTAPTNSQFAEFIFEGDESDDEYDAEETRYWAGCQDAA